MFPQKILFVVMLQIAVTALSGLVSPAVGFGQQAGSAAPAELKQAYEESVSTGRAMVQKCQNLQTQMMHNGYEESGEWQEQLEEAAGELAAHSKNIRQTAIDYFLVNEKPDVELLNVIRLSIKGLLEEKQYELVRTLLQRVEKFVPEDVYAQAQLALVSTRLNDFERGIKFLQRPDAQSALETIEGKLDKGLLFSSSYLQEKWKRELGLRQKDANANLPRVKLELPTGEVTIELFEDEAPIAVANFLHRVESGFYDQTKFHSVVDGQMARGGILGSSAGENFDYTIADEMTLPDARHHFRGTISMFNYSHRESGEVLKDSAHAEFFILTSPLPVLDWDGTEEDQARYTVFGRVLEGIEAVDRLQSTHRYDNEEEKEVQIEGVTSLDALRRAKVIRKKDHQYQFERIEKR